MYKIGGKPLDEVFRYLRDLECTADEAISAFERVIPQQCFSVFFDDIKMYQIGNTSNLSVRCTLKLTDDEGKEILTRQMCTTNQITFKNEAAEEPVNPAQTLDFAQRDALKRLILFFFLKGQAHGRNTTVASGKEHNAATEKAPAANPDDICLKITSKIMEMEGYGGTYVADCSLRDGTNARIVFWRKDMATLNRSQKFDKLRQVSPSELYLKVKGTKKDYKGTLQISAKEFLN